MDCRTTRSRGSQVFALAALVVLSIAAVPVGAQTPDGPTEHSPASDPHAVQSGPSPAPRPPEWQYGGFVDVGYLCDFNHPSNRLFRSRGTAFHVDEWDGRGVRQEEGVRAVSMGH